MTAIEEFIRKTVLRFVKMQSFEAEVVSVDKLKDTIVVKPAEGDNIPDVKLKAIISTNTKKIVLYPAVGSFVTVTLLRNSDVDYYVSQYSEVEETIINCDNIVINGGDNHGLVKIADLVTRMNLIEQKVNDVVSKFNAHTHTGVTAGGGVSGITATPVVGALTETNQAQLEDTKVKH